MDKLIAAAFITIPTLAIPFTRDIILQVIATLL